MKHNANGNGSIRQRPDGRWEARCYINGKRHSFYGDRQNDVVKRMREAMKMQDDGIYFGYAGTQIWPCKEKIQ